MRHLVRRSILALALASSAMGIVLLGSCEDAPEPRVHTVTGPAFPATPSPTDLPRYPDDAPGGVFVTEPAQLAPDAGPMDESGLGVGGSGDAGL